MSKFESFPMPEKQNPEKSSQRPLSKLKKIKVGAVGAMMLGSVLLDTGLSEKHADAAGKPKRPIAGETLKNTDQYLQEINSFNKQYDAFEPSDYEEALKIYEAGRKIEESKQFKNLDYEVKAEFFHRHAYSLYQYTRGVLENKRNDIGAKELEKIIKNISECKRKFEQAIVMEKEVKKRSVQALIELGRDLSYQGISLEAERPEFKKYADVIKKEAAESLGRSFKFNSNPRYISNGLFLFPKEEKNRVIRMVIGLAKRKGQIPLNITEDEAAERISSIHCDVAMEVVPWANSVASGGTRATDREKGFVDRLENHGVLVKKKDRYMAGEITSLMMTDPDPAVFLQVIAQKVARDNPDYLKDAKREYNQLSIEDRYLFDAYVEKEFPNASDRATIEFFFATKHQIGDWRIQAKKH